MKNYINISFLILLMGCLPSKEGELSFGNNVGGGNTNRIPQSMEYRQNMQFGDRYYVTNVILDVFSIPERSPLGNYVKSLLQYKIEFGGACDPYSISDLGYSDYEFQDERCWGGIGIVQASISSPMRYSLTIKACEYLVNRKDDANINIRNKIYPEGVWKEPTAPDVQKLWNLFYTLDPIDKPTVEALLNIKTATTSHKEAWDAIIVAVCSSPAWQVL